MAPAAATQKGSPYHDSGLRVFASQLPHRHLLVRLPKCEVIGVESSGQHHLGEEQTFMKRQHDSWVCLREPLASSQNDVTNIWKLRRIYIKTLELPQIKWKVTILIISPSPTEALRTCPPRGACLQGKLRKHRRAE